jgi:hypothetical protein
VRAGNRSPAGGCGTSGRARRLRVHGVLHDRRWNTDWCANRCGPPNARAGQAAPGQCATMEGGAGGRSAPRGDRASPGE